MLRRIVCLLGLLVLPALLFAGETNLIIPEDIKKQGILYWGFFITVAGFLFGLYQYVRVKRLGSCIPMLEVAEVIYQTCKTYLLKQGKFLFYLFLIIGAAVAFYFGWFSHDPDHPEEGFGMGAVAMILGWTIVGILGSYSVACIGLCVQVFLPDVDQRLIRYLTLIYYRKTGRFPCFFLFLPPCFTL